MKEIEILLCGGTIIVAKIDEESIYDLLSRPSLFIVVTTMNGDEISINKNKIVTVREKINYVT